MQRSHVSKQSLGIYTHTRKTLSKHLSYEFLRVHLTKESFVKTTQRPYPIQHQLLTRLPAKKSPCDRQFAYTAFLIPKFKYAPSVCSSWQHYITNDIEAVQSRSLRFISSEYSICTSSTYLHTLLLFRIFSNPSLC